METLRYGIIGGGFVAGFHLRALESVRGVEVAGITARTPPHALAESARERGLGDARVFSSVRELAHEVDVVLIGNPNSRRVDVMEQLAQATRKGAALRGIACEKPLARNLTEARRVVELAREIGAPTAYFENQIHMKAVQHARAQLAPVAASMGPPTLARAAEEHGGPHAGWFWDPTQQGGGVLSDMGCHSLAVGRYLLTPARRAFDHLESETVVADIGLLKWGQPRWRAELLERHGVDYTRTPAEDFATGLVTYRDPDTDHRSKAQFTVSWMYDKQGLRLLIDALGPGYAIEANTLRSPLEIFVGDVAAASVADAELALEKSTASHGVLAVQPNEADLYGYTDENLDMLESFSAGRSAMLSWEYGLEVQRLVMASYLSAEKGRTIDLTEKATIAELDAYVPLIQQGKGSTQLLQ